MEAKPKRDRRPSSLAPTIKKSPPRKHHKVTKVDLPDTVAGSEVVGREISIARVCGNQPVWLAGKVTAYDEAKRLHQVTYKSPLPEDVKDREDLGPSDWFSLGDVAFTWLDKPHAFPFANPTFSCQHTPRREDALGKRVKVYWSIMGKWYQGTVEAFDSSTGLHRVKFKDGEQRHYKLAHEAFVWLDIPALSSGSAIMKMRAEEGQVPVPDNSSNDENMPPSEDAEKATASIPTLANRKKARLGKNGQLAVRKYTRRQHNQAADKALPNGTNGVKPQTKSKKSQPLTDTSKSQQTNKKASENRGPSVQSQGGHLAEGVNSTHSSSQTKPNGLTVAVGEPEKSCTLVNCLETKSASSSSEKIQSPMAGDSSGVQVVACKASPKCVDVKVYTQQERDLPAGARPSLSSPPVNDRKRSRPDNDKPSSPQACAESRAFKQPSPVQKPAKVAKAGKTPKRQAGRQCKNSADYQFIESCEAIKGSRISVWWESDEQFYKGQVKGYNTCGKALKVLYDDGYSQKNLSVKDLRFNWLSPRALSAGATDKLHEAFQFLGASNVNQSVRLPEERSSVAVEVQVKMEARSPEGLHPSRPKIEVSEGSQAPQQSPQSAINSQQPAMTAVQGLLTSQALANGHPGVCLASVVPVQARMPLSGLPTSPTPGKLGSNGFPGNQQQHAIFLPSPVNSLQRPVLQPFAPSIHGVLQAASCQSPLQANGQAATASPASARPPGSDQLTAQSPSPVPRSPAAGAAAYRKPQQAASSQNPKGIVAVGWKVSLPFRGNGRTYEGLIIAFSEEAGKHRILYEDGEDEWISLQSEPGLVFLSRATGYAAGLPDGFPAPSGKDWDQWRISVYWHKEGEFYDGTVSDPDGDCADLAQLKIAYDDGEIRFENMSDMIFKYLEPPASVDEDDEVEDRSDLPAKSLAKRSRSDPDYQSEVELECSASLPQPRLQLNLKALNSAPARFANRPSIRRLESCRGSLLQFDGEETQPSASPVQSPLSPQLSMGFRSLRQDARGAPVAVRNINGLRTAEGYRVDVKRVRIFYTPDPPAPSQRSSKEIPPLPGPAPRAGKDTVMAAEVPQATAVSAKLKAMLERVEQAKENIRNGMPLEPSMSSLARGYSSLTSVPSSQPGSLPPLLDNQVSLKVEIEPKEEPMQDDEGPFASAAQNEAERNQSILSATPPQVPEHLTPPPSPFQGVKEVEECKSPCPSAEYPHGLQLPSTILTTSCEGAELEANQTSLSLPQTPSAKYEKAPSGTRRTESDVVHHPPSPECCPA